jgi:LmbE family N-acetylglucosaminyl deacetylase
MVFAPHQDDETLACGGLIALKRAIDSDVQIVFITDGRASHEHARILPEKLVLTRRAEAERATTILGIETKNLHFLNYPDGTLPFLSAEERKLLADRIARLLLRHQPQEVYVPYYKDRNGDHQVTFSVVCDAISAVRCGPRIVQYPVWVHWNAKLFLWQSWIDLRHSRRLLIAPVRDIKRRAIKQYSSQLRMLPSGFLMPFLSNHEVFVCVK